MKKTYVFYYNSDNELDSISVLDNEIPDDASSSLTIVRADNITSVTVKTDNFEAAVKMVNNTLGDTKWGLGPNSNSRVVADSFPHELSAAKSYATIQAMARSELEAMCIRYAHLSDSALVEVPISLIRFVRDSFDIIREETWTDSE